jgi:hypothetical protein
MSKFAKLKTSVSTVGVFVELMSVSASELQGSSVVLTASVHTEAKLPHPHPEIL